MRKSSLSRKSPIPRQRKPIARKARPKPVNRKRKASEFARVYGSKERVAWIKQRYCVACGLTGCENAHIEGDGAGRKAGFDKIVPLDRKCHRELHDIGREGKNILDSPRGEQA